MEKWNGRCLCQQMKKEHIKVKYWKTFRSLNKNRLYIKSTNIQT